MAQQGWRNLNVRLNLTLAILLFGLLFLTALFTYRGQQELAEAIALEEARSVTRDLITTFNHMSEIVREEPEENYNLVPQVVATQIAKKISANERYSIRQVSLTYRNPDNKPDSYEAKQLKQFAESEQAESYRITRSDGEEVFRYMQALPADNSCLKCHGSYASAPAFIQARFAQEHPSYGYQVGDIIGAVTVIRPMADLYGEVAGSLKREVILRLGILLLVFLTTWFFVRRTVIRPIQAASATIHQITTTGNLQERIPSAESQDEVGQLVRDFNNMMSELDRTTLQRGESEDRYRSLIDAVDSAIVTFIESGQVIISNQKAEKLLGLSRARLLGESLYDFFEENQKLKSTMALYAKADAKEVGEHVDVYQLRDSSGRAVTLDVKIIMASEAEQRKMFTAILTPADH